MNASDWVLTIFLIMSLGPVVIYFTAKLATTGYLVARKRFEERNSNQKKEGNDVWH